MFSACKPETKEAAKLRPTLSGLEADEVRGHGPSLWSCMGRFSISQTCLKTLIAVPRVYKTQSEDNHIPRNHGDGAISKSYINAII